MSIYSYPPPPPNEFFLPTYTTYGYGMTAKQFYAVGRTIRSTRWILLSITTLFVMLAIEATAIAAMCVGVIESTMISALMMIAGVIAFFGMLLYHRREKARVDAAWRVYETETAGGLTTTMYVDRVVQTSARWREEILLNEAKLVETSELLMLESGHRRICWRAADLTPAQAWVVIMRLRAVIPQERQFASGVLMPARQQPCPPPFSAKPPVCYDRFTFLPEPPRAGYTVPVATVLLLAAVSMVAAAIFTVMFAVTAQFMLDYLIFSLACFVGSALLSALITHFQEKALIKSRSPGKEITLSFTGEGLLMEQNGQQRFVAACDVHATRTQNGATLHTPVGNVTFPWAAANNRQQLEWMLFSEASAV